MGDSLYEEQLSAAKFRAERDMARQEVKELREELDAIKTEREYDVKALNHRIAEMEPRLMPEGCEWPRYESGEKVELGDEVVGPDYDESIHADEITFHANGFTVREKTGLDHWYESDARFKRPSVLAADGEPLEVGQTVWHIATGREYTVRDCTNGGAHLSRDGKPAGYCRAEYLTHAKPEIDSWERIEEDAELAPGDYIKKCGRKTDLYAYQEMPLDLVRRCKKLAGVSE